MSLSNSKISVTDHVRGTSTFTFYKAGNLWYRTDTGLEFPVPIDDLDSASVEAEIKSMTLMRWVRKHVNTLNEARAAA
jgi:hypothetical protein